MKKLALLFLLPFSLVAQPNQGGGPFPTGLSSNAIVNIFSNVPGVYAVSNAAKQSMIASQLPWAQGTSNYINSVTLSNVIIFGQNALVSSTNQGAVIALKGNDSLYDISFQGIGAATGAYQNVIAPVGTLIPQQQTIRRVTSTANADGLVGSLSTNSTLFVQDSSFYSHFDSFNVTIAGSNNARGYILNTLFSAIYNTNVTPKDGIFGGTVRGAAVQGGTWYLTGSVFEGRGSTNGGYNTGFEAAQDADHNPVAAYLSGCRFISSTTNGGTSYLVNLPDDNTNSFIYCDSYLDDTKIGQLEAVTGTVYVGATNRILFPGKYLQSTKALGSAQALTTAIPTNVTSMNLPKGDWDVEGKVSFGANAATITQMIASLGITSQALTIDAFEGYSDAAITTSSRTNSITLDRKRIRLASETTVYLVGQCTFTAGAVAAFGNITARRINND
jgi:hypothetical protein